MLKPYPATFDIYLQLSPQIDKESTERTKKKEVQQDNPK